MKKICLITPSHIASNPRLVKEAHALDKKGYSVHIIFCQLVDSLKIEDQIILDQNKKWTYDKLDHTTKSFFVKAVERIRYSISSLLFPITHSNILINRNYTWQIDKAVKAKADLYIAHNLGSLPIAEKAAKINNVKFGFDAEDFHRHETTNDINALDFKIKSYFEDKFIPKVNYLTTASPLITVAYKDLFPNLDPVTINNVFPLENLPIFKANQSQVLRLFWFSQTIGKYRGLEDIIKALNELNTPEIELHLLGKVNAEDKMYFSNLATFKINYHSSISPHQLFEFGAEFDIGLALELNEPLNRNLCLTNKVFTYLLCGLATIATNTQAQAKFYNENSGLGSIFSIGDITALKAIIKMYFDNRGELNNQKFHAYKLAQEKYNWELESQKYLQVIEKTLNH